VSGSDSTTPSKHSMQLREELLISYPEGAVDSPFTRSLFLTMFGELALLLPCYPCRVAGRPGVSPEVPTG